MSSAVSSFPSGPGCTKLQAHCCPTTRTVSCACGSSCLTWYQTRTAATRMITSNTSTAMCGQVTHLCSLRSSPVMYWAGTPSFLRKRTINPKNTSAVARNQAPTTQKMRDQTKSMSPAKVEPDGTRNQVSIRWNTDRPPSEDEQEDHEDEGADERHREQEAARRQLVGRVGLR